jgi:sortase (surface protein transpeptidase)
MRLFRPGGRHREAVGLHRAGRRPARSALRIAMGSVSAVAGILALTLALPAAAPTPTAAAESAVPYPVRAGDTDHDAPAPIHVRVPAIGVDSSLLRLGVDRQGALVPPADFVRAGWFAGSAAPGDTGPAVLAGHVDSYEGPAVFFRLAELERGDEVLVERADGTTVRFTVTEVDRYPKDEFPTELVYGATPRAELRLITCGGEFDRDVRSYRDNVVVSAVLAG